MINPILHTLAIDIFDGDVVSSLVGFDGEDLEHIGVIESCHGTCFSEKTLDKRRFLSELFGEHLESDVSIEALLASEVDFAHATFAEFLEQFEVAQLRRLVLTPRFVTLGLFRRLFPGSRIILSHLVQVPGIGFTWDVGFVETLIGRVVFLA